MKRLTAFFCLLAGASEMQAHSMQQSALMLDFVGEELRVELQLPVARLGFAFGQDVNEQRLRLEQSALQSYVASRFVLKASDGHPISTRLITPLIIAEIDGARYLIADFFAPLGAQQGRLEIQDNVILDRIPAQVALVSIRSDWRTGTFAYEPQMVGVLRSDSRSIIVDRGAGNWMKGFANVFRLGVRHIAEGTDHLLFLLALLLPAPLIAVGRSWTQALGVRRSLVRILQVVTAFTIGHSITLAMAALGVVSVPSRPIEVLIAASILISAIHALVPLFAGREPWIAGFFGLIHGLAFATTLGELGLHRWERVAAIAAFNLGIEAMQLVVVAAVMPSLLLLSGARSYTFLRMGGAAFAGIAAIGWTVERLFGWQTRTDSVVDWLAQRGMAAAIFLFGFSLFHWLGQKLPPFHPFLRFLRILTLPLRVFHLDATLRYLTSGQRNQGRIRFRI